MAETNLITMPILALRGITIFPEQTIHFDIGRMKSVLALEAAMKKNQSIMLIPQKDILKDDPCLSDFYPVGTVAKVKQILKSNSDNIRVLVTGLYRAKIEDLIQCEPYLQGHIKKVEEIAEPNSLKTRALRREANTLFGHFAELTDFNVQSIQLRMFASESCGFLADSITQNSSMEYKEKAKLLCILNPVKRLECVIKQLRQEIQLLQIENEIQDKTRVQIDQEQRDYFLREQIKVIHEELGDTDETSEFFEYENRILSLELPKDSEEKLLKDLSRLKKQPFGSAEASVIRNYLDIVLELPWNKKSKERVDISAAQKILEKEHHGLTKVKERILETIAVRQLTQRMPPQILCFVGPPGVGKTSIAYSIAHSLNRKLVRIALGGVHDEADIRGHRKTYVGAMPGRILSAIIQAGTSNPVLLLDEIDKMGSDYRGDPSAALLEVLDSEQNKNYRDHYLELPFDLSDVFYITTANTTDTIPKPLLDRMEIIELGSYTDEEKLAIAKKHLIPKQQSIHGIQKTNLRITDDAIREIIRCYTRESGVRNLERNIADICRKSGIQILQQPTTKRITVTGNNIAEFLGVRRYLPDRIPNVDQIGLVTGLAWTTVGGEVLEVEVNIMEGNGKLELTGNLGNVMKESVQAALSYIRSNTDKFDLPRDFYKTQDIHVHFPEGAIPKDGPSAGITVCTALISALTGMYVRSDVAMTGEISLRGRVLPIGGLKEKTMAAMRHGIQTVIIPKENEKDLEEIDPVVRKSLNFVTVQSVDAVLDTALYRKGNSITSIVENIPPHIQPQKRKPVIQQ